MQLVLKANKTSMYKLVQRTVDFPLPKMRDVTFSKQPRVRNWWMEWYTASDWYTAHLFVAAGKPRLYVYIRTYGLPPRHCDYLLSWSGLFDLGMVDQQNA